MRRAIPGFLILLTLPFAQAQNFTFFTFDPPGSTSTTVSGINNAGQIVGRFADASGSHGFVRTGATYTNIDIAGANPGSTSPNGINSAGQITGSYSVGSSPHGFLRSADGSTITTFDVPNLSLGVPISDAHGINDKGEIVGVGWSASSVVNGFLRSADGSVTPVFMQGWSTTAPMGINNEGTISGYFVIGGSTGVRRGFLRSASGAYTTVDVPGIEGTEVTGINNRGQITGDFGGHGFVRNADGTFVAFDVLGATATFPTGINDNGQVAGYYTAGAERHGFLAIPAMGQSQPAIRSARGVISAFFYGAFDSIAPGSWIEVYGQNLAQTTREWRTSDFSGDRAPTLLEGVSVRINGQPAYISYVSPGQVNAQVPSTVPPGDATVTVMNAQGISTPYRIAVHAVQPGLLAFPGYNIGNQDYLVALFPDNTTYVLPPGRNPSLPSARAKPGDTIVMYGIGFGPVIPDTPAGRITPGLNTLPPDLQIWFGGVPAKVAYAGLAPGAVGLYQFNVEVPEGVSPSDAVSVTFQLNGIAGTQHLQTTTGQ